jgi:hypothetical protein
MVGGVLPDVEPLGDAGSSDGAGVKGGAVLC